MMNKVLRSVLFWILSVLLAAGIAVYQRITGPTYPINGEVMIGIEAVSYTLIRTWGGEGDAKIVIPVQQENVSGEFHYRRYKSHDGWTVVSLQRVDEGLACWVPHQPPAGKVEYEIRLFYDNQEIHLTPKPVIIRFKGAVPEWIVLLHIIFIFLAFIFSMRTGFEALVKGRFTYAYTILTVVFLFLGGILFGPLMQKYAFGVYWAGWPLDTDLTDNKTAVAFLFWLTALIIQFFRRSRKGWAAIAAAVLLVIYLIPHSLMGSEIDHTKTGKAESAEIAE